MISTVTTTTSTYTTYDLYVLIWAPIVILVSFAFHYIKINEYKGIITGSILIGVFLGLIYGIITSYISMQNIIVSNLGFSGDVLYQYGLVIIVSLILIIAYVLAGIILAFLGGTVAIFKKKVLKK